MMSDMYSTYIWNSLHKERASKNSEIKVHVWTANHKFKGKFLVLLEA